MRLILGLDQSTSATKGMLFNEAGEILAKEVREHRQIYPRPGWVEHDPEEIWQNVLAVVGELRERQSEMLGDIVGISISNQRETFVVFDRQSGKPLHNAIVWQCRRGEEICRELTAAGHAPMVQAKTGLKLDTYFPASKIMHLMREHPTIAAVLRSGEAVLGTIDTYLIHRLTNGKVFATDPTNASRTLLFDVHRLEWDNPLCELFEIPQSALAEVRECSAEFGITDVAGTLPRPIPICGVMGDSQASLFAQRCFQVGTAKATFGTGTSVLLNVGSESRFEGQSSVLALAWVIGGRPTFALEGLINYSSATIAWLRDQLGLIGDAAESEALANSVPDNGGVYLVPAFSGLSAPYWKPEARAAILGMSGHTEKAHIVRAALEAIGYQIRDVLEMMHQESGVVPKCVLADGGPTRNRFLMQFTADMIERELVVAETAESSALGAAMMGMLGLGIHNNLNDLATLPRKTTTFRPQLSPAAIRQLHAGWLAAVERLL